MIVKNKFRVNDPCPCGSGIKYKKCHQRRKDEKSVHPKEIANNLWQAHKLEICHHPNASNSLCGDKIINAHTIQKRGTISKIVDEKNKVLTFYQSELDQKGLLKVRELSWKQASTFKGFCSKHDASTFADLETRKFVGDEKQCFLMGYRALSNEMHQKLVSQSNSKYLRSTLDKGKPFHEQMEIQLYLDHMDKAANEAFKDIKQLKEEYDAALQNNDYSKINHVVIWFEGDLSLVSTGVVMPEFEVNGKPIQDINDLNKDAEALMCGLISVDNGGAFIFSWLSKIRHCNRFVESILMNSMQDISSILIEFVFNYIENT